VNFAELAALVQLGESDTLEFKKSTAELTRAGQTLCAFLNTRGGRVLLGVTPQGRVIGQMVSDGTQQEIAGAVRRLDPAATVGLELVKLQDGERDVVVLSVQYAPEQVPFTFEGRAYQRLGTTTVLMPQGLYQQLLLNRAHSRARWETAIAEGIGLEQLDKSEILRSAPAGTDVGRFQAIPLEEIDFGDILDRLGVRRDGAICNAAVVLFGLESAFPEYPQCVLRLARFKGTNKAEFLDNRQVRGHAFVLVNEAMLFMERHLPVAAHVVPGQLERVEEAAVPD
jgi:ATP-dependent DNA helicase RecG